MIIDYINKKRNKRFDMMSNTKQTRTKKIKSL